MEQAAAAVRMVAVVEVAAAVQAVGGVATAATAAQRRGPVGSVDGTMAWRLRFRRAPRAARRREVHRVTGQDRQDSETR